jgi:acyl-CoA synthetase (AMP-forming)/AMP-acid ligase II
MRQMGLDHNQVAVVTSSMMRLVGFGMMFLAGLLNGATVVITRPFDYESVLQSYERWGSTYVLGLPVMFRGLLQAQLASPRDVASGQFYFCGGDCVPPTLQEAFGLRDAKRRSSSAAEATSLRRKSRPFSTPIRRSMKRR